MENANVGGNRGTFGGGEPGDLDVQPIVKQPENFARPETYGATNNFAGPEIYGTPENFEQAFSNAASTEVGNKIPNMETADISTTESRPLAADGTTEGKIGRLAVQLSGEMLDEASAKEVKDKIVELKDDPYELQNYRDEAMVDFLRDNFGRIFGDTTNNLDGGEL